MFSPSQQKALDLLDKYFVETKPEDIKKDVEHISSQSFVGSSAEEYFNMSKKIVDFDQVLEELASIREQQHKTNLILGSLTILVVV